MIGARCVRLDVRSVILIILCFFFNGIKYSNTGKYLIGWAWCDYILLIFLFILAVNHMEVPSKYEMHKNNSHTDYVTVVNILLNYGGRTLIEGHSFGGIK